MQSDDTSSAQDGIGDHTPTRSCTRVDTVIWHPYISRSSLNRVGTQESR